MNMAVESIPSPIAGWYDPDAPQFKAPKSWDGTHVRLRVAITTSDPVQELALAKTKFEKLYPGAQLHLVPEFQQTGKPEDIEVTGSDEKLLRSYFSQIELPKGVEIS